MATLPCSWKVSQILMIQQVLSHQFSVTLTFLANGQPPGPAPSPTSARIPPPASRPPRTDTQQSRSPKPPLQARNGAPNVREASPANSTRERRPPSIVVPPPAAPLPSFQPRRPPVTIANHVSMGSLDLGPSQLVLILFNSLANDIYTESEFTKKIHASQSITTQLQPYQ